MRDRDKKKEPITNYLGWSIFGVAVGVIIWGICAVFIQDLIPANEQRGQFGDMFGAVNSLISGLALAGIVISLIFQRRDIELTLEEMNRQVEEMAGSKKFLEQQSKTLHSQRVQDSFYSMLRLHADLVSQMETVDKNKRVRKGAINFQWFNSILSNRFKLIQTSNVEERFTAYNELYEGHTDRYNIDFDSYLFRLETLLVNIETSGLEDVDILVDSLRGCMSKYEDEFVKEALHKRSVSFVKLRKLYVEYKLDIPAHQVHIRRFVDAVNGNPSSPSKQTLVDQKASGSSSEEAPR